MTSSGKDAGPHGDELSPEERQAFQRRASELGRRLDEVRARKAPPPDEGQALRGAAMGQAMKIAIELVVGVAAGGLIGRVLDGYFATSPWLMLVFLLIGFAAGLTNVIRSAQRMQAEAEPLQRQARDIEDDDV